MESVVLSEKIANSIRCALCDAYLSVPPVWGLSEDGMKYRCGRCEDVECKKYTRVLCYENVAQCFLFPCRYKQCEEKIPWGKVTAHEKLCPYRTVPCPRSFDCKKTLLVSELEGHFKQMHSSYIMYERVVASVEINTKNKYVFLLVDKKQLYFIYIYMNKSEDDEGVNCSFVAAMSLSPLECSRKFNLELTSDNSNSYVFYKDESIVKFDERWYCYSCISCLCKEKHHPYSKLYSKSGNNIQFMPTKLDKMALILKLLENPEAVKVTIDLVGEEDIPQIKEESKLKKSEN